MPVSCIIGHHLYRCASNLRAPVNRVVFSVAEEILQQSLVAALPFSVSPCLLVLFYVVYSYRHPSALPENVFSIRKLLHPHNSVRLL